MEYSNEQIQAIGAYRGQINVIACAGAGKTSVIVNRIHNLIYLNHIKSRNILVVTFSNSAVDLIEERINNKNIKYADKVNVHTFHSLCCRILNEGNVGLFNGKLMSTTYDKINLLGKLKGKNSNVDFPDKYSDEDIIAYIELAKNNNILPSEDNANIYRYDEDDDINIQLNNIYREYEIQKVVESKYDYEDLLTLCYKNLKDDEELLKKFQDKYRFILVDEMQDTNKVQFDILQLLTGQDGNLFMVGDYLQCIYGFRGSDSSFMINFNNYWPKGRTINMNTNYRCSGNIIKVANQLANCMVESKSDNYVDSLSFNDEGQRPLYNIFMNKEMEASYVATIIKSLIKSGYQYKDIAVLSRSSSRLAPCESIFSNYDLPYYDNKLSNLSENNFVKMILGYIVLINNPDDDMAYEMVFNSSYSNIPQNVLRLTHKLWKVSKGSHFRSLSRLADDYKDKATITKIADINHLVNIGFTSISDCIDDVCDTVLKEYYMFGNNKDIMKNYVEDSIEAVRYIGRNCDKILDFVKMIRQRDEKFLNDDRVNMMTIHASKGLEFPVVFVIGLDGGRFPSIIARDEAEEWRLLYVAMTRAKERLYLSSSIGRESKFLRNVKAIDKQLIR